MPKIQQAIQRRKKSSRQQHVLAKLRKVIGGNTGALGGQRSAPASLGIPATTCASIESGRRDRAKHIRYPLTEKVARQVSAWTGISPRWLLGGDADAPMIGMDGKPFTRETFDRVRHDQSASPLAPALGRRDECLAWYMTLCAQVGRAVLAAVDAGDHRFACWKLGEAIDEVGKRYPAFGSSSVFQSTVDLMKAKRRPASIWQAISTQFNNELLNIVATQAAYSKHPVKPEVKAARTRRGAKP